ncbi:hypothetical protein D3C85_1485830 [compost metagenome]
MDQGQVQVVGLQFLQTLPEAFDQAIFCEVGDPDLAGDEQVFTGNATGGDGFTDFGFVFVDLRGVDGPVAQFQAGADRIDDYLALQAKRTQAECGDRHD